MFKPVQLLFFALALPCAASAGWAQDDAAPIQSVEVKAVRTRLVAYKTWYERARQVRDVSEGRIALGLRLAPAKPGTSVRNLQLALETGDAVLPVPVDDTGFFVVPVDDAIAARDGAFAINRKAGTLSATAVLVPTLGRGQWTFGAVKRLMADAGAAAGRLAPWYLKPAVALSSPIHSVSVCSARTGAVVKLVQGEATAEVPLAEAARDDAAPGMLCHHFSGKEKFDEGARLVLPEDAQVLLL
jgi:hypothetical protein